MKNFIIVFAMFLLTANISINAKTIRLTESNTLPLIGFIDTDLQNSVQRRILELNSMKTDEPIFMYILSNGGVTANTIEILRATIQSRRVIHTITHTALSNAFNIVQLLKTRYITNKSIMMTHPVRYTTLMLVPGNVLLAKQAFELSFTIYKEVADRMKLTFEQYIDFLVLETRVSGNNLIKMNMADELVTVECDKDVILKGGCPEER